ncbi:NAD-dependent epimerase/dehydratase family protein [Christensenellaceae bacterium OttesenSCG-928-M15]|nr:NAD-dependent epimerase/dehydratase family protein [Christensenellaceae bacterium OttesenSCG-928-M15]
MMKVLFIGGNGNISWNCVQKSIDAGHEVVELNRAATRTTRRAVQPEVRQIVVDIHNQETARQALEGETFDAVCDFICFNREQAQRAVRLFRCRTKQYIAVSSEAVYKRESRNLPFRENAEQYAGDVADSYIAGKIQVENVFEEAYEKEGFPVTIVRPGYTYDTIIPAPVGQNCFTAPRKFIEGYPLLMPGDGENLWSPLHAEDFAQAFVHLIGNKDTIGEAYHITGESLLTWNELARQLLTVLGADCENILHIPRKEALNITAFHSKVVMQQHMWHYVFDNTKIKSIATGWCQRISFAQGIDTTVKWLQEADVRRRINPAYDDALEQLYGVYWKERK